MLYFKTKLDYFIACVSATGLLHEMIVQWKLQNSISKYMYMDLLKSLFSFDANDSHTKDQCVYV